MLVHVCVSEARPHSFVVAYNKQGTSDILHTVELIELWYPQFLSSYHFLSWLGQKAKPYSGLKHQTIVESPDSKLRRPTMYEASEWLVYYVNLLALKSQSVECQVCNNEARLQPYCICSVHMACK